MTPEDIGFVITVTALWAVGAFFVLHLGLGTLRRLRAWEARAVRMKATVVRHEARTYKGNTHHHPVVRFVTPAGDEVVFEADRPRRRPDPPVGGELEVLYDPETPSAARLPGQGRVGALFMAGVGVVFLVVGIVMAVAVMREGVRAGKIDVHKFVEITSTNPARMFGLWPRKGRVMKGAPAVKRQAGRPLVP